MDTEGVNGTYQIIFLVTSKQTQFGHFTQHENTWTILEGLDFLDFTVNIHCIFILIILILYC